MTQLTPEDRRMMTDSLSAVLARRGVRGNSVGGYPAPDATSWRDLAELGVLALRVPEELGGLGLGFHEIGPLMRTIGRFASVEPFVASVVLGGSAILGSGQGGARAAVLGGLAAGECKLALAYAEPGSRHALSRVSTSASASQEGHVLSGHKAVVLGAPDADQLVVSARVSGEIDDTAGIALFLVDRLARGVTLSEYYLIDGRRAAEVVLDEVQVGPEAMLAGPGLGYALLERIVDEAAVAACHECVGAMERLNEITTEHCRERIAFGQPIAANQVVRHRLVDMHVAVEHASAIADAASEALCGDKRHEAMALVSAAKVAVGREARFVGEAAVQLHGAAGTTEDVDVGRYFKRILVNGMLFGDSDYHLQRYIDLRHAEAKDRS